MTLGLGGSYRRVIQLMPHCPATVRDPDGLLSWLHAINGPDRSAQQFERFEHKLPPQIKELVYALQRWCYDVTE